jgi:hypothetical protein
MEYHLQKDSDLLKALRDAGPELMPILKNKYNYFSESNYLDIAECIRQTRPVLTAHDMVMLSGVETRTGDPDEIVVTVSLWHAESGEHIDTQSTLGPTPLHKSNDTQMLLATGTYLRRNMMMALLMLAGEDDDSDGLKDETEEDKEAQIRADAQRRVKTEQDKEERKKIIDEIGNIMEADVWSEKALNDVRAQIRKTPTNKLPQLREECKATLRKLYGDGGNNE